MLEAAKIVFYCLTFEFRVRHLDDIIDAAACYFIEMLKVTDFRIYFDGVQL